MDSKSEFQNTVKGLLERIDSGDVSGVRGEIAEVKDRVASEFRHLPSYDQKYFVGQLDTLMEKLEAKEQAGKKRFAFRSRLPRKEIAQRQEVVTAVEQPRLSFDNTYASVEDSEHVYVRGITDSVVRIENSPKSVHIERAARSVIVFESSGPVFISGARDCVVAGSCRQLRMKGVHECKVFVDVTNTQRRIVFEDSDELAIGRWGDKLVEVDDFHFPNKAETNPHFVYTEEDSQWLRDLREHIKYGK